ncbi:MAG TPA: PHP domain-containing protein, partial [Planctomycetota bacterium]|nr:PHP domain-containing protein [Planctomycetota bacterium]
MTFENPFRAPGRWWRGNLHTHTTRSDGELSPDETAAAYRSLGYDFLAITDHGCVSEVAEVPEGLLLLPGVEHGTVE